MRKHQTSSPQRGSPARCALTRCSHPGLWGIYGAKGNGGRTSKPPFSYLSHATTSCSAPPPPPKAGPADPDPLVCVCVQCLVTDFEMIAYHYMTGWFGIDLISSIPLEQLGLIGVGDGSSVRAIKILKLMRLLRVFRLGRMIAKAPYDLSPYTDSIPVCGTLTPLYDRPGPGEIPDQARDCTDYRVPGELGSRIEAYTSIYGNNCVCTPNYRVPVELGSA